MKLEEKLKDSDLSVFDRLLQLQYQFKEKNITPLIIEYHKCLEVAQNLPLKDASMYPVVAIQGVKSSLLKKYGVKT